MLHSKIAGIGFYVPEKVVTNADLMKVMDTTDEWIRDKTGIQTRRIARADESLPVMMAVAAQKALKDAGISAQDIDYIDAYVVSEDTTYFMETGALRPFERRYFSLNSVVLNLGKHPKYLYVGLKDMNGLVSQIELGTIRPLMN
jgi:hypothetical protein